MGNNNKGSAATTVVAVVVSLAVAGFGGYMLGNRAGQASSKLDVATVATVNGDKITKLDMYERMARQYGAQTADELIREKLVEQAAKEANVSVSPSEVDAEIAKIKKQIGGEEKFNEALAANNITLDQLKEYQVFRLRAAKILGKDIPADDAALKAYFEENKTKFDKREVHARHILVATEEEAKAIKAELDKGADFTKLAKEKSTEPAAKESGGDLGFFGPGKMVPEFEKVAFSLKKNEISQPVKSQFGWHIIQVLDTKGTEPTFEAVKDDVKAVLIDEKVQEKIQPWLEELKAKAKITNEFAKAEK